MGEIFDRAEPSSALAWTGERLTTETGGQVEIEHLHRYFFARSLCRGLDVLDVASGEGYGAALLAQAAKSVVGVEVAEDTVEHARAAYSAPGLTFLHGDARRIPCPDQSFDAVVSFETLEHFYEHDEFVAEVRRVLRPGGLFIISSPERDVYSPAGGTPNPYHVHELTHAEFDTLLRANFGHVAMYAQRPLLGSALVAEGLPAEAAPLLTFEKRDAQRFEASVGLPRPIYLVAVASDQPFVPRIGSLYIETSGVEALLAAPAAARQEIRSLTERLTEQGDYAQRVQAELNRRDEQLSGQVAEAQEWHRQLVQRNEEQALLGAEVASLTERLLGAEARVQEAQKAVAAETASLRERLAQREAEARSLAQQLDRRHAEYDGLVQAHGALLKQRAERYARHEAAYRAELERQAERSATREAGLRARLAKAEADAAKWHADTLAQQARAEGVEDHLRVVLDSSSWRLTGPVRGIAARHPKAIARAHGFLERHPHVPRAAARSVRGAWRAVTLRSARRPAPAAITPLPSSEPPPKPAAPDAAPAAFRHQALLPLAHPPLPPLPRGHGRRVLCVGHVWPCPPRAGNEYRIHRMLAWFAQQGWDVLLVVCPLPHEMPSEQQMAGAAAVYPNLLVCDRAGTLYHRLPEGSPLLDSLQLGVRTDIPALLHEDDGGDPAQARLLGLLRTFCPDALVELLLHLRDGFRPDLLLAEYVFMTRPFPLLPGVTTAIDTIDVFSTKAHKVERHGVSDGLALSEPEEAGLLRRADILIGIQPDEARDLARLAPDRKVVSIGVDFAVCRDAPAARAGAAVLLVASGNPMNAKGLSDFLAFCWPVLCRELPEAELLVVGAVGDGIHSAPGNVRVLGRVEDLGPFYAAARVVINPAAAGTGLKIKTVEALCHLRPVVCWPSGADGLSEEARAFCHVAADWFGFAAHIKRLLVDDEQAFAVEHARTRLEHAFSPGVVYAPLADALDD
jgi:SAM-dependent methyltransferase